MDTPLWQKLAETNALSQEQVDMIKDQLESKDLSAEALAGIEHAVQIFIDTVTPLKIKQYEAIDSLTSLLGQSVNSIQRQMLAQEEQMHKVKEEEEGTNLFHQL